MVGGNQFDDFTLFQDNESSFGVSAKMVMLVKMVKGHSGGGDDGHSTKSNLVASVFCPDNEGHLDFSSGGGWVASIVDGFDEEVIMR